MLTRNFSIIAHIDHGKSTLADRMLEYTRTVEKRKMREQVLDSMDLERERGITIKMQPVRMRYEHDGKHYVFNLIDTPGHIDFSYEVSRALSAVEGTVLLVDSTQGVQAQTLSVLRMAQNLGLTIVPVLSKIDSPLARIEETRTQLANLVGVPESEVLLVSGKTGEGVPELLATLIDRIPPPAQNTPRAPRALVYDFSYSDHQGVVVQVRMKEGSLKKGDSLEFAMSGKRFTAIEVGVFAPAREPAESLSEGEIGYVVTGIKEAGFARVGDTVRLVGAPTQALGGFELPRPVVWASIYPESQDTFPTLRTALGRLQLSDAALSFEEESSGSLGRGFRCGFLGLLHLEIIAERLRREFGLVLVITTPTITYVVETKRGERKTVYSPSQFPPYGDIVHIWEPFINAEIILPNEYLGTVLPILYDHEAVVEDTRPFAEDRSIITAVMPLRELMRHFFDSIKSVSAGYASVSWSAREERLADVVRLDLLVAEELMPAFSRVVANNRAYQEGVSLVEKLYDILPRQMFATKIQSQSMGRILSSKTLPAMSKDVTGYLYGGDRTRKMKLWAKQKRGKARMKAEGRVNIPEEVFLKMVKNE